MRAYTYRIGWSKTQTFYYGVRYAKNCSVDDLWTKYFTSSKHVKSYTKKHGKPDIIEIRKTFNSVEEAQLWETRVITRANLVKNKNYLNYTNNIAPPVVDFDRYANLKGKTKRFNELSEDVQNRIRKKQSETAKKMHSRGQITYKKPEDTTNYKLAAKKRWSDPSFKKKFLGQKWMWTESKTKKVSPDEWQEHLNSGWKFGRGG